MKYTDTTLQKGLLVKKAVVETIDTEPKTSKKAHVRKQINEEVFDLEDSVADNAKMISLLISVLSRIYNSLDETIKDNMSAEDRALVDMTFNKFSTIHTRADVQFAQEGPDMIDKLLNRQGAIGDILK